MSLLLRDTWLNVRTLAVFRQSWYLLEKFPFALPDKPVPDRLDRLAALAEPVRRALYRFVAGEAEPVSRERAALGVGVALHVAKFHLDRLVQDGLLEAEYRRPAGRGGPGAGRPAKLYRRAGVDIDVSLPERRYGLAGQLLVRATRAAEREGVPIGKALDQVALEDGRSLGTEAAAHLAKRSAGARRVEVLVKVLADQGYEPRQVGRDVLLANCPFRLLAAEDTELVCGMNLAFVRGVLDGLDARGRRAVPDPAAGRCCVRITATPPG